MDSFFEEDLDALLRLKRGDPTRLNRIKKLCENHKLIPISDRKYIERLASQYLNKEEKKQSKSLIEPIIQQEPTPQPTITPQPELKEEKPNLVESMEDYETETVSIAKSPTKSSKQKFEFSSKNKFSIAIAAIALAIILVVAVSFNVDGIPTTNLVQETKVTSTLTPPYITLEIDQEVYEKADIISVSGESNPIISGNIDVRLENSAGEVIWQESVQVKNSGEFSTLLIAGGNGWGKSGEYTLIADHNTLETRTSFNFNS